MDAQDTRLELEEVEEGTYLSYKSGVDPPVEPQIRLKRQRTEGLEAETQASCASGEFFVWRRDEVVLGCGQLVAQSANGEAPYNQVPIYSIATSKKI